MSWFTRTWRKLWGLDEPAKPPTIIIPGDARRDVRAVLCGLTRYKNFPDLPGPAADAVDMYGLLTEVYRVDPRNITMLRDEELTWSNKYEATARLIRDTKDGEFACAYHAGHGTLLADADGDDETGWDQACVVWESAWKSPRSWWRDDDYARVFKPLAPKAILVVAHDTCHSDSMTRTGTPVRYLTPPLSVMSDLPVSSREVRVLGVRRDGRPQRHVALSACRWDQNAYGFWHPAYPYSRGRFSFAQSKAMRETPLATWNELHRRVRAECIKWQEPMIIGVPELTRLAPFQGE